MCSPGAYEPVAALAVSIDISSAQKQTPDQLTRVGGLGKELDDDLLSHGETPHYHRRCVVSLLSSGRDQVVPTLYGRQAIQLLPRGLAAAANRVCDAVRLRIRANLRSVDCTQIVWVLYGQASRAISIG